MKALYYYIIGFIFLVAGIPLTYFGYYNGVKASEVGDNNDSGFITMMVFGILFIVISFIIFITGVRQRRKEKMNL